MKIGYDAKRIFKNTTGLGNYGRTLVSSLARFFPENEYVLFTPSQTNLFNAANSGKIKIVEPTDFFDKTFKNRWRSSEIKKDLLQHEIELFHGLSHQIPKGLQSTGIKSVVTIHDLIFELFPDQFKPADRIIYRRKFKYACNHSDHIIAISIQTKNDIARLYEIPPEKITVCYQSCDERFGIAADEMRKIRVRENWSLPQRYFLYVGSVIKRKNLLALCRALYLVRKELDIPLVVIGTGKAYKKKVKRFLKENSFDNRVIFLSEKEGLDPGSDLNEDLPAIYQMADAFIYPGLYEGFGIPVLEALQSGTPVITTNTSCMPETGGNAALYVPVNDDRALADALMKIANDPALAAELRNKGWKHAESFSAEKSATAVMNVYQKILYGSGQ